MQTKQTQTQHTAYDDPRNIGPENTASFPGEISPSSVDQSRE